LIKENNIVVGRQKEQAILREALQSNESELVAVLGRRRVGKTYLVKQFFREELAFELTGIENATTEAQLQAFSFRLSQYTKENPKKYDGWMEAMFALINHLDSQQTPE